MSNKLMSGLWKFMLMVPPSLWEKQIAKTRNRIRANLKFMTEEHRLVHHYVVRELPRDGKPMKPETISKGLNLDLNKVKTIVKDLEKHMTFLVTNTYGSVIWAYPVTVEQTPHRVTFNTGEQVYAAWAADVVATPFVQGLLRQEPLTVDVETSCAHCAQPMRLTLDSDLNCQTKQEGCEPIVFVPEVDVYNLEDPSIIEAFWKKSVFFWSEEHAREYRRKEHRDRGAYFTLEQFKGVTKVIQGELFGYSDWYRRPENSYRGVLW